MSLAVPLYGRNSGATRRAMNQLSSYIVFQLYTELIQIGYCYIQYSFYSTTDISVNLLHCSDISRTLTLTLSKQHFVPKTKQNIGKRAFSMAAPTLWNQLPISIKSFENIDTFRNKKRKLICLKLFFNHKVSAVPSSNDNVCLSPCLLHL